MCKKFWKLLLILTSVISVNLTFAIIPDNHEVIDEKLITGIQNLELYDQENAVRFLSGLSQEDKKSLYKIIMLAEGNDESADDGGIFI